MKYEICYLVGESNEAKLAEIKTEVEKIIVDEGGEFQGIETNDRRKLAYKVQKDIRGLYITRRFELSEKESAGDNSPLSQMTKKLNLYSDVLRFLIIRADKLSELKQRAIPIKVEKGNRRFDRSRFSAPAPLRREAVPKMEMKKAETQVASEETKADSASSLRAKEELIDQKLDELLNL